MDCIVRGVTESHTTQPFSLSPVMAVLLVTRRGTPSKVQESFFFFFFNLNLLFCIGVQLISSPLVAQSVKSLPATQAGINPQVRKIPGEGNGYPLQYSCLENPMDRGAWRATVHGVTRVGHN